MAKISSFGLLRIAALPISALFDLAPPLTTRRIDAAARALAGMESRRERLEHALHAIVPLLAPNGRRAALEIKRAVHNARAPAADQDDLAAIAALLAIEDRNLLTAWLSEQQSCSTQLTAAEACYAEEVRGHLRPSLQALAAEEAFLRPLALASPSLLAALARGAEQPGGRTDATKRERGVLRYAIRAAAKCSPFSIFMHQALVDIAETPATLPKIDPGDRTSRTYLDRSLLFLLQRQAIASDSVFFVNPSITWHGHGRVELLAPDHVTFSQRLLRIGKPSLFQFHPVVAERIARLPSRFLLAELENALAETGLDPATAERFAAQLRERGIVLPQSCFTGFDARPEKEFLASLRSAGGRANNALYAMLDLLIDECKAFARAPSRKRASLVSDARSRIDGARCASGETANDGSTIAFWEDGVMRRPLGPTGETIHNLVLELANALRPHAVMTAPYLALRAFFIGEHGAGGRCEDVTTFLSRASAALAGLEWWRADPALVEVTASPHARIAATALIQFAGADEATFAAGDGLVILNGVYPGCGWLSARHAFGQTDYHRQLRVRMTDWIAGISAPAEPVDLMLSGDCNALQAHPRLTRRAIQWPIEPAAKRDKGAIAITDIAVQHVVESGLLEVFDRQERQLAPIYLGTTVPHPAWGPEFWLTTLASPYRIARPIEEMVPPASDVEMLVLPRRSVGRVVLRRGSWWMTSARMRRCWYRRQGAARLLDVAADCDALQIPRRLFIRAARSATSSSNDSHKPLWIDIRNPFCLDTLFAFLTPPKWLLLTEALPDVPFWPTLAGRPHTSEMLVEMLL